MIAMRLREAAGPLSAQLYGEDVRFHGVSTDTRDLQAGQLFVALRGPNFDGHQFTAKAAAGGAAAALVDRETNADLPFLKVSDTRVALGQLAANWRAQFDIPLIAVTGTNGKTTVKEMIAAILGRSAPVLATRGNLNNDIGVPLTLFNLGAEHRHAVIEMGANHEGEIRQLCRIAQPTIAAITLCAPAHIEGFGSIEGVARAKGEIVTGLSEQGIGVLNADDTFFDMWRKLAGARRVITFGFSTGADVTARMAAGNHDPDCSHFTLVTPVGEIAVQLSLPGRHNVMNALTASACAFAAGANLADIKAGLESMRAVKGRLVSRQGPNAARVIDDTYNANPSSLRAAIDVLVRYPGRHWLVMGDMGELGSQSQSLHHEAGLYARAQGVDRLFAIGEFSRTAAAAFGAGAEHHASVDTLIEALRRECAADITVLVKGSRSMRMERVVQAITEAGVEC